tara:strand:- start:5604 stop:6224 length:621 start_codon:yes stop_codon:yes gene_type:complete
MVHEHKFWVYDKVIPEHICDQILNLGLSKELGYGLTSGKNLEEHKKEGIDKLFSYRKSNTAWLEEEWIYKEILAVVNQANKDAGWNYDFDRMETAQFTKYGVGQYYHWHVDSLDKPFQDKNNKYFYKKIRKLSMSLLLTDPNEFEGGEFEFDFSNVELGKIRHKLTELNQKGSIVVFPSDTFHRVNPVTKGIRYSLVIWCCGAPFK